MKLILSAFFLLISTQVPAFSSSPQLQKVRVALDWTPNTNHTGIYVAKAKGYFKDVHIDPVIIQPAQATTTQLVATGGVEFGVSFTADVLKARDQKLPLVSVAAIIQENTSCFAWREKTGIKTPKDWEGKRYGGWGSPEETATLKYVMEKYHSDFSKLKMVTTGVSDFLPTTEKNADFMWIYMGWDGIRAKLAGVPFQTLCLRDIPGPFNHASPLIVTSEALVKKNPDLVRRFLRAITRGYLDAIHSPEAAAHLLLKEVPELDEKLVVESAKFLAPEYAHNARRWGLQKEHEWNAVATWFVQQGFIKKAEPANNYFSNAYLLIK